MRRNSLSIKILIVTILHVGSGGYLSLYSEVVAGKRRKYYRATQESTAALESAKERPGEAVAEVLHDRIPGPKSKAARPKRPHVTNIHLDRGENPCAVGS